VGGGTTTAADDTIADFKYASGTVLLAIAFATVAATASATTAAAAADRVQRWFDDVSANRLATATIHWSRWLVAVRANVIRLVVRLRHIVTIQQCRFGSIAFAALLTDAND